ncbi:hypothetical protein PORY_002552 [Pneumocystis oryctolagi]|uniref:Uncharacterized protein n=1 Tax=Pneumocystis oryctolagi TaxID=42067 RepID=A0ACB7C8L6_9ASCO|nr:hypothetical protein PORY_002552 [Pneumocystis oryctolagi]
MNKHNQWEIVPQPLDSVSSLCFSPFTSMHLAITSWDKTLKLFDITSIISDNNTLNNQDKVLFSFEHKAPVLDCCFSTEIHLYSGGLDRRVRKFDLFASSVSILGIHDDAINSTNMNEPMQQRESSLKFMTRTVKCTPDGQGGGDGIVALWDGVAKKRLRQYPKYPASISSLAFSNDGKFMAIGTSDDFQDVNQKRTLDNRVFIREILEGECRGKVI